MDKSLKEMLEFLKIPGLIESWDKYLETAKTKNLSNTNYLKFIIEETFKIKKQKAKERRFREAEIPEMYVIETFPFNKQPKLNKKKILEVYDSLDYITKKQNIIWIGPTGSGKTGLGTSFLVHALNAGYRGRFITFPDLMDDLYTSVADHSEAKVIRKFASYDCLLIDEIGYVPTEEVQSGMFFRLMSSRHKHKTTIITSNLGFKEWGSFLKNDSLTSALVDRLTERSYVFNMRSCVSIRDTAITE